VRVAAICLLGFVIVGGDWCGWLFLGEFNDGFSRFVGGWWGFVDEE
jgi:hypothetical protein